MDEKLDQIRKILTQAANTPTHIAAADQLRAGAEEVAMTSLWMQLVAFHLVEKGDEEEVFKHQMATVAHYRSNPPQVLAAAMVYLSNMIGQVLIEQWGSIENVLESLNDPDLPLFVEVHHQEKA